MLDSPDGMFLPSSLWPAAYRSITNEPWPPVSRKRADAFVQACVANGLLSLLFEAEVPDCVRAALADVRAMERANVRRTRLLLDAFGKLAAILGDEPFVVLKGLDFAFRIYRAPHLRQMADIDILVPRSRSGAVATRLREAGIRQSFPAGAATRLASHHETVFELDGVTVEPHHGFIQRQRHNIDYDAVWQRRLPFQVEGIATFRLCDEDAILYAALTLATNAFDLPAIRYLDLCLLLDRYHGDLLLLASRARQWRIERAYFAALDRTATVFPEILHRIRLDDLLTPGTRRFLRKRVLPTPIPRLRASRTQQLWRKYQLMDGNRERFGFLIYHVFAAIGGNVTRLTRRGIGAVDRT